jgi:type VI secretion system secreted protein Hcp
MGKTIPKAKLEFIRADGDGKPICYYAVELENVMIGGVNPSSGDSGIRGGTEGNSSGGWDCAANKCV